MIVNTDQAKGRFQEAKGRIKELAGKLTRNGKLEARGRLQRMGGKVEGAYGDLKKDLRDWTSK